MNRLQFAFAILYLAVVWPSSGEGEFPKKGWEWIREDTEGWRIREGGLELRSQKGRIWAGGGAKNLLIEKRAAGGLTASVDVSHSTPKTKYEQGGLLVYRDDDHFVKLIVEFIDGDYFIVMARKLGRERRVFTKIEIEGKAARIRLAVEGDKVRASFSAHGGDEFEPAGECELPGAATARFALFTQDGSDTEIRWTRFENLVTRTTGG